MKLSVLCLVLFLGYISSERILGVFPFSPKSHFYIFEPLLLELAKRGHELTVISHFPRKTPIDNYTDININAGSFDDLKLTLSMLVTMHKDLLTLMPKLSEITSTFEDIYRDERVDNLLKSTVKFDLIISELFLSDMFVGLTHRFQAPLVMLSSSEIVPWAADRFALPDNPSYIPHFFTKHVSGPMNLYDRVVNTLEMLFAKYFYEYSVLSNDDRVSKLYLGHEIPHVKELIKRTSLVLVNSHFSINGARALPPQVVEIGGVHIKAPKPLPQDIEKFINESEHGVVYFSFGSVTNASTMSAETRKAFCDVFSKLPQRVLWKWEIDEMPDKPPNVKIVKWMPQRDILAHPNIRLFITHGGLLGTMEGVYSGVPMIGIPLFGDQTHNIANLEYLGYAIRLEVSNITWESVSWAVNSVLNDPKYKNTALHVSQIFRDRPATAIDTAIYWTEYVMKHQGAHHLRTAAVGMPWYQYFLIDVILFILLAIILIVFVIIYTVKIVLRKICSKGKVKLH